MKPTQGERMSADATAAQVGPAGSERRERGKRRLDAQRVSKYRSLKQAHRRLRVTFRLALVSLGLLGFAVCAWALHATSKQRATESLRYQERGELLQARRELEAARAELALLVAGRIPGLLALELEQVIPIGNGYVRNAIFTRVEEAGVPGYEYQLLLKNDSDVMAQPLVDLVIFDRVGVEIGRAQVGGTGPDEKPLFPGASRSYSGALALLPGSEPAWFRSQVH